MSFVNPILQFAFQPGRLRAFSSFYFRHIAPESIRIPSSAYRKQGKMGQNLKTLLDPSHIRGTMSIPANHPHGSQVILFYQESLKFLMWMHYLLTQSLAHSTSSILNQSSCAKNNSFGRHLKPPIFDLIPEKISNYYPSYCILKNAMNESQLLKNSSLFFEALPSLLSILLTSNFNSFSFKTPFLYYPQDFTKSILIIEQQYAKSLDFMAREISQDRHPAMTQYYRHHFLNCIFQNYLKILSQDHHMISTQGLKHLIYHPFSLLSMFQNARLFISDLDLQKTFCIHPLFSKSVPFDALTSIFQKLDDRQESTLLTMNSIYESLNQTFLLKQFDAHHPAEFESFYLQKSLIQSKHLAPSESLTSPRRL